MELPQSLRDELIDEIDAYVEAVAKPEAEQVTTFVIELLEGAADELDIEDVIISLEEDGSLDDTLATTLEEEMESNDEFEYTGEEVASLLERLCHIEWADDDSSAVSTDDDDDDDDDEL